MKGTEQFDKDYAAEQLRRSRHPLRKIIKRFYLDNILRDVRGLLSILVVGQVNCCRVFRPGRWVSSTPIW